MLDIRYWILDIGWMYVTASAKHEAVVSCALSLVPSF